jgi:proline dehydrogenase
MEVTENRLKRAGQSGTPGEGLTFDNTEIAFSGKTNADLRRAYWLFKLIGNPVLTVAGKHLTNIALALRLPIKGLVKATIFKQFVGGETIAECESTAKALSEYGVGTILDYSLEGKDDDREFEATTVETLKTIDTANNNDSIPFSVFKVSGICRNALLEKVSTGAELTADESYRYERLHARVTTICRKAHDTGTPIFIDAEESWIQPAIDALAMEMMAQFNKEKAVVYNTLQMYRHDRLAHLKAAHETAVQNGFYYGVKLVRGAYMEKERDRAEEKGYPSPIQPDKAATDRDFDAAVAYCLQHIDRIAFCAGTHNEASSLKLAQDMDRAGVAHHDKRIYFAQLYGMSDHISFNLSNAGYNVAKYVPYGPVKEVMPYLIRRAEENTSVAGQVGRELGLIMKERRRRKV